MTYTNNMTFINGFHKDDSNIVSICNQYEKLLFNDLMAINFSNGKKIISEYLYNIFINVLLSHKVNVDRQALKDYINIVYVKYVTYLKKIKKDFF